MLLRYILPQWCQRKLTWLILPLVLLISYSPSTLANTDQADRFIASNAKFTSYSKSITVSESYSDSDGSVVEQDPLNSPHPIPWNWIMNTHAEFSTQGRSGLRYYRTPSLISPDGQYAAYSRIQMQVEPELFRSRVTSVMFIENLPTGDLQTITPSSPLASDLDNGNEEVQQLGKIAILIPISWSEEGDRLLLRQFEGFFNTSDASDYAVIWQRRNNTTINLTPSRVAYTNAILLGWSQTDPEQVLFRAGILGEEEWPVWSVDLQGQTVLASQDKPIIYGRRVKQIKTQK